MLNLTNLPNVKQWAKVQSTSDDQLLTRLISSCSTMIMSYLQRQTLFRNAARDVVNGNGKSFMYLLQWPVNSVTSLVVNGVTIPPAASPTSSGWLLSPWDGFSTGVPQALTLNGYAYSNSNYAGGSQPYTAPLNDGFTRAPAMYRAQQNVEVDYVTGYIVQNEPATIPAANPYQITAAQILGTWGQDDGVTFALGGAALVKVASGPASGQYAVTNGLYTFAAADTGKGVNINYSYIPPDIEQACIELVGERYSYKGRIGQKSSSLGGQVTTSYNTGALTDSIKLMLNPYRRTFVR